MLCTKTARAAGADLQLYIRFVLHCTAAADAATYICNGLRPQVVLQVIIFVRQHPLLSLEWLADPDKARMGSLYCISAESQQSQRCFPISVSCNSGVV